MPKSSHHLPSSSQSQRQVPGIVKHPMVGAPDCPTLLQGYKKAHRAKHSSPATHTQPMEVWHPVASNARLGCREQQQEAGRWYLQLSRSSLHGTPRSHALLMSPHLPRCCQREKSRIPPIHQTPRFLSLLSHYLALKGNSFSLLSIA